MIIKNATKLSSEGLENLERLYTIYFRDDCVCHTKPMPRKWEEVLRRALRHRYAKEMMRRIKSGERTCMVECDGNEYIGAFITGNCEKTIAEVSHVRVSKVDPVSDRMRTLDLYKAFVSEMEKQGAKKIHASVEKGDKKLIDLLEVFGLSRYGKLLSPREYLYTGEIGEEDEQKHL